MSLIAFIEKTLGKNYTQSLCFDLSGLIDAVGDQQW